MAKGTNKKKLIKGCKYLAIALPLAFLGPSMFYSAFGNRDKALFIPVVILAAIILVGAVFCMYKGIQTIMHAIFND